jgi:hypothetical protein
MGNPIGGRVFVLGAGVSKSAQYPLGIELFDEIDKYIRSCGKCYDGFDYQKDWRNLLRWLDWHKNPLISEAHRKRLTEYLFTLLDIADALKLENAFDVYRSLGGDKALQSKTEKEYRAYVANIKAYPKYRHILLLALEAFLEDKHQTDNLATTQWETLLQFGDKLRPGDTIVTFNYDASIERVLWKQEKWSPNGGFGFGMVFQNSRDDHTRVEFKVSKASVLHLHGAIGWYDKPTFRPGFPLEQDGGAIAPEDLAPGPKDTEVSLAPSWFGGMKIAAVDASMPDRPSDEGLLLLQPSFLKDYELETRANRALIRLWKRAAEVLRSAQEVYVVGYSLPKADSAALTLLITNCDPSRTRIVNQSVSDNHRLRRLLSAEIIGPAIRFEEWVKELPR